MHIEVLVWQYLHRNQESSKLWYMTWTFIFNIISYSKWLKPSFFKRQNVCTFVRRRKVRLIPHRSLLAKIFEIKDTWYHFLILMTIDLTERKILEIWTFCVKSNWSKHSRPFAGISKDYSCWYWYLWWWTEQFLE